MHVLPMGMVLALALCAGGACTSASSAAGSSEGLRAFSSEAELQQFARKMLKRRRTQFGFAEATTDNFSPAPMVMDAAPSEPASSDQITNVQETGIDEGGIVKVAGDYLVVLRRGRIFTIKHGGGDLAPIDTIDAFPPGDKDPDDAWYDEMLVSGDQVVVIGYSYGDFGTEVSRFRLATDGSLAYRDTHYLRSGDYYSSSNYASRLIGDELILYAPVYVDWYDWRDTLPSIRDYSEHGGPGAARPLVDAREIYVAEPYRDGDFDLGMLHTVTRCDLSAADLDCSATAVVGSWSRSFYVAQDAVYVWSDQAEPHRPGASAEPADGMLYRLPFDGDAPGAIQVSGGPIDQFSFRADADVGLLRVLLREEGSGDAMWAGEASRGKFALLDLPLGAFGDGSGKAARGAYRPLPGGNGWRVQNRFVGGHLLYATSDYAAEEETPFLYAVPLAGGEVELIELPHGVSRLDMLGADGVAIGPEKEGALGFSAIRLDRESGAAGLEDTYLLAAAREGEVRSQAFFFRPDPGFADGSNGTLGLPVTRRPAAAGREFLGSGSAIAFLRRERRELSPAGELVADDARARPDNCRVSCVDWYGNARPIFLGQRVFALMGYELVEGRLASGRIAELRRADFSPGARTMAQRGD
jgi:hypothetical protein